MSHVDRAPLGGAAGAAAFRLDPVRHALCGLSLPALRRSLDQMLASTGNELQRLLAELPEADERLADEVANLSILRRHAIVHEERWAARLRAEFAALPRPPAERADSYSLLSEAELQSQLVGQPVIEALDRRHADVLDVIDSRLWDLASRSTGRGDCVNPVAPRVLVDALLEAFPASEVSAGLRARMLRHYQIIAGEELGSFYAAFNTALAESGFAMSRPGRYAVEVATAAQAREPGPVAAPAPGNGKARTARALAGEISQALRRRVAAGRSREAAVTGRQFSDVEFLAVLSLSQPEPLPDEDASLGARVRSALMKGAGGLGLSPLDTSFSPGQADAIDLVGLLLDGLQARDGIDASAACALRSLAFPFVRLVLTDPDLFDDADDPAMCLLGEMVALWERAPSGSELHSAGLRAAEDLVRDYHGDPLVFPRVLHALQQKVCPVHRRSDIALKRAWEAFSGRERLELARREADSRLQACVDGRSLLPTVMTFLDQVWRPALVQAWLRGGVSSPRFNEVASMADALVRIDEAAAGGDAGGHVAQGLFDLQQALRDCHVACGLDPNAAGQVIATLVSELANPDAPRIPADCKPMVAPSRSVVSAEVESSGLDAGQEVTLRAAGVAVPMRLAGVSEHTGQHLFVDATGAPHALPASEVVELMRRGELKPRPPGGAVQGVLGALIRS